MRYGICKCFVAILSMFVVWTARTNAAPFFTGIGPNPNTTNVGVTNISDDGLVAVGSFNPGDGGEALRWTAGTGIVGLGNFPGGDFHTQALAASVNGNVIAGITSTAVGTQAFVWTPGSGLTNLGVLPGGGPQSFATAVSADGSVIVGQAQTATSYTPFVWTKNSGMANLGDLPGGTSFGAAYGVSAFGTAIVGLSFSSSGQEAFRWTPSTGMVGLGDLPGSSGGLVAAFDSRAYGVSSDGQVVVGASQSTNGLEAFRWTSSGGMIGLGDLSGGTFESFAEAVSGDGSVVVGEANASATASSKAFIWDAAHGMRSLQDVLVNDYGLGASLAGWTLHGATGISADGKVIVGFGSAPGTNPNENNAGWIVDLRQHELVATRGDVNLDGHVDATDLQSLLQTITDLKSYQAQNGLTADDVLAISDINQDGVVNNSDVAALMSMLHSGGSASNAVPEPSTICLMAYAGIAIVLFGCRRKQLLRDRSDGSIHF
jgi:probable HAF family extracellular repeat protein